MDDCKLHGCIIDLQFDRSLCSTIADREIVKEL